MLALYVEQLQSTDPKERLVAVASYTRTHSRLTTTQLGAEIIYAVPALLKNNDYLVLEAALKMRLLHPRQLMPGSGHSLLQEAVFLRASDACVLVLMRKGVSVEFNALHFRGSALHMAVAQHDVERVVQLVELEPEALELRDPQGRIPLQLAVQLYQADTCRALMPYYAQSKNFQLLLAPSLISEMIRAQAHKCLEALQIFMLFLEHGMDVDSTVERGCDSVFELAQHAKWKDALREIAKLDAACDDEILRQSASCATTK